MDLIGAIGGFDWDAGNTDKSFLKHGVSPVESQQVFYNTPLLLLDDTRHSLIEPRFHALGKSDDGRFLQVTFTLRRGGKTVRIISARAMNRKERSAYAQKEAEKNSDLQN